MSSEINQYLEWQIVDKKKETQNAFTYVLSPISDSQKFDRQIGQFVMLGTYLKLPTIDSQESFVQRAYSIASSPQRKNIELTIKLEKPLGYINPNMGKADGFAAYFIEQAKIGNKVKIKPNTKKNHFLYKVAEEIEKDIAYWSGSNGAESARSLIQYMEDTKNTDFNLILFYSNPNLRNNEDISVIYYSWLIERAKEMNNFKVIFTFTKDYEVPISDHSRIIFRKGRFFSDYHGSVEKTLSKYHGDVNNCFNPVCGSSAFINGVVKLPDGKIIKSGGIIQSLLSIEGVKPEKIDKEQFYLQVSGDQS